MPMSIILLRAIKFPTVIVDEASQATEPATLVPLTQVSVCDVGQYSLPEASPPGADLVALGRVALLPRVVSN